MIKKYTAIIYYSPEQTFEARSIEAESKQQALDALEDTYSIGLLITKKQAKKLIKELIIELF